MGDVKRLRNLIGIVAASHQCSSWGQCKRCDRQGEAHSEMLGILDRLEAAESPQPKAQGDGWVSVEERMPEHGDIAWIVWEGTVQEQPWQWLDRYNMPPAWHFEDGRITEGVSHYMLANPPAKPKVP